MKLGILSDTHGNVARTRTAIQLLLDAGAERLLHCGDVEGEDVLYAMASLIEGRGIELQAVFGNVDEYDHSLKQFPMGLGISIKRVQFGNANGKEYAIAHGHEWRKLEELSTSPNLSYLFTGHTHRAQDDQSGPVRVINPGAVNNTSLPSVAVLDTETDELNFISLPL